MRKNNTAHQKTADAGASKWAALILALTTMAATFIAYAPSLKNNFVNWDDRSYIYENTLIRSVDLHFFKTIFTEPVVYNWHPLTVISYAINYAIWGYNPYGYHFDNALFHSINVLIIFYLVLSLAKTPLWPAKLSAYNCKLFTAAITALLFGLHPQHVESVAWISERKDVLSTLFFLACVLAYLKYASLEKKHLYYALTLIFFILGLMSKPMVITLPVVLLILDFYPLGRLKKGNATRLIIEKAPFFALSAVSAALTIWAQKTALATTEAIPLVTRLFTAVRSYAFYLYKMILPLDLVPYYPYPENPVFFSFDYVAAILIIAAITVFCLYSLKYTRAFLAVWLFYVITLSPVIGIIQVGAQAAADRYMYLPSIAPLTLMAIGACYAYKRFANRYVISIALIALTTLGALTVKQTYVWKNPITLWTRQIEKMPIILGYTNRATAYHNMGRYKEAVADYTVIIESKNTDLTEVFIERGLSYQAMGEVKNAIDDFSSALVLSSSNIKALNNRGNAYKKTGEHRLAINDFEAAVGLEPSNPVLYYNLSLVYLNMGSKKQALEHMRKAANLGLPAATQYLRDNGQ
jgi:tetratricopeptide (TPR) repeat protein